MSELHVSCVSEKGPPSHRITCSTDFGSVPVTRETKDAIAGLAAKLGAEQRNPDGFDFEQAWETWGEIAIAERAATGGDRARERVAALNASLGEQWAVARGSARGAQATVADYAIALTR